MAADLLFDRAWGRAEEGGYRTLRSSWGPLAQRRFFFFFETQAIAAAFCSLPMLVISHHPVPHWTPRAR